MTDAPEKITLESEIEHTNAYCSEDRRTWLHGVASSFPDYFLGDYIRLDTYEALEAENKRLRDALVKAALEHRVIAGMDLMGASSTAYNAAREAEAALEDNG